MELLGECHVLDDVNATGPCSVLSDAQYWPSIVQRNRIPGLEVLFTVLFVVVLLIGLVANSVTLAVFSNLQTKLVMSNNNMFLLLNLCVCDNLTVFLVVPFSVVLLLSDRIYYTALLTSRLDVVSSVFCNVIGFVFNCTSRSILFLLAIAATDRAIALFIPFKYKQIVTIARVKVLTIVAHVTSLLVSLVPFATGTGYRVDSHYAGCHYNYEDVVSVQCTTANNTTPSPCRDIGSDATDLQVSNAGLVGTIYFFLVVMVVVVPAVVMVSCSVAVVHKLFARVKESKMRGSSKETGTLLKKKNTLTKREDPQVAAAITIGCLVTLYIICYLPWWLLTLETFLEYTGGVRYRSLNKAFSGRFSHYFMLYLTLLTYLNSAINPLIYFGRNKQLMDMFDSIIRFRSSLIPPPLKKTISGPVSSVETF